MRDGHLVQNAVASGSRNRLNASLSFDSLIEGSANRMARAAALHVSDMPGQLYNPLFIYGGVGLGKTHLMHAVGNRLLARAARRATSVFASSRNPPNPSTRSTPGFAPTPSERS